MSLSRISFLFMASAGLAACDLAYPVAVVGEGGTVFRGYATDTFLEGGSFQASNGKTVCTGTYDQHRDIAKVTFPVRCSNGLKGVGTAFFQTGTSGGGFVTMSDGSRWQFIFGRAATSI